MVDDARSGPGGERGERDEGREVLGFRPLYRQVKELLDQAHRRRRVGGRRRAAERAGDRRRSRRVARHRAQGARRAGGREPGGPPPGQGHLRRPPRRRTHPVPVLQAVSRYRRAALSRQPNPRCRGAGGGRRLRSSFSDCAKGRGWCASSVCARSAVRSASSSALRSPRAQFPGIEKRHLPNNLYELYRSEFGVTLVRATEHLKAVAATRREAKHLAVAVGAPLLSIDRVAFGIDGRPVEWRRSLCRTDASTICRTCADRPSAVRQVRGAKSYSSLNRFALTNAPKSARKGTEYWRALSSDQPYSAASPQVCGSRCPA